MGQMFILLSNKGITILKSNAIKLRTSILTKVSISSTFNKMHCHPIVIGSGEGQNLPPLK